MKGDTAGDQLAVGRPVSCQEEVGAKGVRRGSFHGPLGALARSNPPSIAALGVG